MNASLAAAMACRASISSAMVTLFLVGYQVNDLGSVECDELAVDVGAVKGFCRNCGFVFVHLRLPYDPQQSLPNFAEPFGPGYNFILAE
jgi:hypothetical protein